MKRQKLAELFHFFPFCYSYGEHDAQQGRGSMADRRAGELSSGLGYHLDLKPPGSQNSQNLCDSVKGGVLIGPQVDRFHLAANCWRIQLRLGESGLLQQMGGDGSDPSEIRGPYLDPHNPQTKVLVCTARLVPIPHSIAGLRRPAPATLSNVPRLHRQRTQPQRYSGNQAHACAISENAASGAIRADLGSAKFNAFCRPSPS